MPTSPAPALKFPFGEKAPIRLAMLGMIAGNGHPYSWSAIINSYNKEEMAKNPYAGITKYLGAQPFESVRIPGSQVTHVWTEDPKDAEGVSKASLVPNIVSKPEDVIGHVDAVLVSTDDGYEHVRRSRAFVEAGLPVFVDKPLAISVKDLQTFIDWEKSGSPILSSSGMRYAPELDGLEVSRVGEPRWLSLVMAKAWENYGIHALEPIFKLLGPGFISVRMESQPKFEIAHLTHKSGVQINLVMVYDSGVFGTFYLCGTKGEITLKLSGTDNTYYQAFRRQLVAYIDFLRSGVKPYPFAHTVEMMTILIAGLRSRAEGGRRVEVAEIMKELKM